MQWVTTFFWGVTSHLPESFNKQQSIGKPLLERKELSSTQSKKHQPFDIFIPHTFLELFFFSFFNFEVFILCD